MRSFRLVLGDPAGMAFQVAGESPDQSDTPGAAGSTPAGSTGAGVAGSDGGIGSSSSGRGGRGSGDAAGHGNSGGSTQGGGSSGNSGSAGRGQGTSDKGVGEDAGRVREQGGDATASATAGGTRPGTRTEATEAVEDRENGAWALDGRSGGLAQQSSSPCYRRVAQARRRTAPPEPILAPS